MRRIEFETSLLNTSFKELLAAAAALDAPTDDEKGAMKEMKDEVEAKMKETFQQMFQTMAQNPDAEVIGSVLMQALNSPEMKENTDKLKSIYGLEDEAEELEIGE